MSCYSGFFSVILSRFVIIDFNSDFTLSHPVFISQILLFTCHFALKHTALISSHFQKYLYDTLTFGSNLDIEICNNPNSKVCFGEIARRCNCDGLVIIGTFVTSFCQCWGHFVVAEKTLWLSWYKLIRCNIFMKCFIYALV